MSAPEKKRWLRGQGNFEGQSTPTNWHKPIWYTGAILIFALLIIFGIIPLFAAVI